MSTAEQRRVYARLRKQRHYAELKTITGPSCAYCGIMARNYLHASLSELVGGGYICDRCVREAQRGAKMTRDVT